MTEINFAILLRSALQDEKFVKPKDIANELLSLISHAISISLRSTKYFRFLNICRLNSVRKPSAIFPWSVKPHSPRPCPAPRW